MSSGATVWRPARDVWAEYDVGKRTALSKMSLEERFERWMAEHSDLVGTVELPKHITELPEKYFPCANRQHKLPPVLTSRSVKKFAAKVGLRITRGDPKAPWEHYQCSAKATSEIAA